MKQRRRTEKGYMPWTVDEVVNVAREANKMAKRVGGELVLSAPKLRALGLSDEQIDEVQRRADIDTVYV
jgi:hypothetical protein